MAHSAEPIELIRVADYWLHGLSVKAECICGRTRIISPSVLIQTYGEETRLNQDRLALLGRRLKCGNCGAKSPKLTIGEWG